MALLNVLVPFCVFLAFYAYKSYNDSWVWKETEGDRLCDNWRYLLIFGLAVIVAIVYTIHVRAMAQGRLWQVQIGDLCMALMTVVYTHFVIEADSIWHRLEIALVSGLGYMVGSGINIGFLI